MRENASVVELVDTLDSKSGFFGSAGSSPATGTNHTLKPLYSIDCRGFFVLKSSLPVIIPVIELMVAQDREIDPSVIIFSKGSSEQSKQSRQSRQGINNHKVRHQQRIFRH